MYFLGLQNESFGNGVASYTEYDPANGWLFKRQAGVGGGTGLIDAQVSWDLNGNFTTRQDLKPGLTESFVYDPLNRLDYSTRNGTTNLDVTLDAIGNVTWKSGVGSYSYHATKRRAVIAAGANSYGYDANGNLTSRNGNSISYTSYNLPGVINAGTNSSTLSYGAWRNRSKQVAISGGSTETTISVAGLLEKVTRGSVTEYRHRIAATPGVVALYTRRSAGSPLSDTYYLHRDHLGSPELITRANGTAVVGLSFGAYGERRDTDWDGPIGSTDLATLGNTTREGYTGHAMLDGVGLVHMNGRVYDPVIGRFLSRDPIVDGRVSQGANGYAYVWNNPLTLTDPSGYVAVNVTNRYLGFTSNYLSGGQWIDHPVWAEGSSSPDSLVVASRQSTWVSDPMRSLDFQRSLVDHALGTESAGTTGGERGGSRGAAANNDDPAKRQQDSSTCTADGTISDFLEQQGTEILNRTFAIVGGAGQIGLGVGICGSAFACVAGAVLGAHGASNVYEGVTGSESLLRDGYRSVLGSAGNLAYSSVDISSSVYGLTRRMLRPGSWSLFRHISSDYFPAFKAMTGVELITESAGLISAVAGAAGLTASRCQP